MLLLGESFNCFEGELKTLCYPTLSSFALIGYFWIPSVTIFMNHLSEPVELFLFWGPYRAIVLGILLKGKPSKRHCSGGGIIQHKEGCHHPMINDS